MQLPDLAKKLIDDRVFATLATINPNGSPQSSVIWAKRDGDAIVFSTIEGRRKTRNMRRDPRVSLLLFDPDDPYRYAEIRGTISLATEGGRELIEELSHLYDGKPFRQEDPSTVRLVCRLTPARIVTR